MYLPEDRELLFSRWPVQEVYERRRDEMLREVDRADADEFLAQDPENLAELFFEKYVLTVPRLEADGVWRDPEQEIEIKPRSNTPFAGDFMDELGTVKAFRYTFHVPFQGHPAVFRFAPSVRTAAGPPYVHKFSENELLVSYDTAAPDAEALEQSLMSTLDSIRRHLGWLADDFKSYNLALLDAARQRIEARQERLRRNRAASEKLTIPLKPQDPPEAYNIPLVPKPAPVIRRTEERPERAPYWAIEDPQYKHILSILEGMSSVMERSPDAFRKIKEEALRWHFVLVLNGHYPGGASGETFNASGKTDILLQWEGKVAFIAECKFWDGQASLERAVDQLFKYVTWRDTHTAILLFNRKVNFSAVLAQIPSVVENHESFKEHLPYKATKTAFRFRLRHPRDPEHEMILTILAFDVPS